MFSSFNPSLLPSPSSSSILRLHVQSSLPLLPCSLDEKKGEHVSVAFPEPRKKRVCNSLARPFTRPLFSRFFWMTHKARRREGGGGIGGELENSARCVRRDLRVRTRTEKKGSRGTLDYCSEAISRNVGPLPFSSAYSCRKLMHKFDQNLRLL